MTTKVAVAQSAYVRGPTLTVTRPPARLTPLLLVKRS